MTSSTATIHKETFPLPELRKLYELLHRPDPHRQAEGYEDVQLLGHPAFCPGLRVQYKSPYTHLQGLFCGPPGTSAASPSSILTGGGRVRPTHLRSSYSSGPNIMGYSVIPLRMATYCGYFFSLLSILGAVIVVIRKLLNRPWPWAGRP